MATEYILWGFNHRIGHPFDVPLKLTGGSLGHCRAERAMYQGLRAGWRVAIYREGDEPTGLRLQALDGAT